MALAQPARGIGFGAQLQKDFVDIDLGCRAPLRTGEASVVIPIANMSFIVALLTGA